MNHLIQNEVTGTAEEFAGKVNISRSMLMENIREMRDLGAMDVSAMPTPNVMWPEYCYA